MRKLMPIIIIIIIIRRLLTTTSIMVVLIESIVTQIYCHVIFYLFVRKKKGQIS
jgi:hypothetical protein